MRSTHWARTRLVLLVLLPMALLGASQQHYYYGNPTKEVCRPGEINVTLKGVPGIFCSPPCSASQKCPSLSNKTIAPPGDNQPMPPKPFRDMMAKAECAIELKEGGKATYCAMVCDPSAPTSILPRHGCPGGDFHPNYVASCQTVETIGICTYSATTPGALLPPPGSDFALSQGLKQNDFTK